MVNLSEFGEAKPPARQQLWHVSTGFFETSKILSTVDAK
jgi:hypothetical protein